MGFRDARLTSQPADPWHPVRVTRSFLLAGRALRGRGTRLGGGTQDGLYTLVLGYENKDT